MTGVDLHADMAARWRPSAEQIEAARAFYAGQRVVPGVSAEPVYTLHLLENKRYGLWTEQVRVVPVPGLFTSREGALLHLEAVADEHLVTFHGDLTAGYATHWRDGEWAVFEDCVAGLRKAARP